MNKLRKKNLNLLKKSGVYHESMEHDACGVGLVASTDGKKSRKVVEYGIQALKAVWHRGAIDADGKTGDGAGIHIEIPSDFFIEKIEATGHKHDDSEVCVGMLFLPRNNYSAQEECRSIVESELTKSNFNIYGWRQVPVDPSVLGETAESNRPEITQVLFKHNTKEEKGKKLEIKLYEARRKIEKKILEANLNDFYICSFSSKSIIYKGMFLAEALSDFYLDLKDERFTSRYAIFHQRFSTNTAPSWDLAQPFRALAHNGEINTLKGNINWMRVHEEEMFSPIFEDMENLKPVIPSGNSDSASLDNVFEILNISGQPAPLAKLMLIPDAWSKKSKILPADHQKLFNFLNSTMEPWDGPAAIAATDNEWVIVATDRNGLRPMRYTLTKDNLLFAGSETGMMASNKIKLRNLSKKSKTSAKRALDLLKRPDQLLSAILVGNNFANILASAIVTIMMLNYFGGNVVLGSIISQVIPSSAKAWAAFSQKETILPVATNVQSLPSETILALPKGTKYSSSGTSPEMVYKVLCSKKITGSSSLMAVAKRPLASAGVDGIATFNPGIAVTNGCKD